MSRQIRRGGKKTGLILANGGVLSYQHTMCLSKSPRRDGLPYPEANPLSEVVSDVFVPKITSEADGPAIVEVCRSWVSRFSSIHSLTFGTDLYRRVQP